MYKPHCYNRNSKDQNHQEKRSILIKQTSKISVSNIKTHKTRTIQTRSGEPILVPSLDVSIQTFEFLPMLIDNSSDNITNWNHSPHFPTFDHRDMPDSFLWHKHREKYNISKAVRRNIPYTWLSCRFQRHRMTHIERFMFRNTVSLAQIWYT